MQPVLSVKYKLRGTSWFITNATLHLRNKVNATHKISKSFNIRIYCFRLCYFLFLFKWTRDYRHIFLIFWRLLASFMFFQAVPYTIIL